MDPITHVATGLALSQLVPAPSRLGAAVAGLIFAMLPDLDYVAVFYDRLSYLKHHRGFTHSLPALFLFVLLGAYLGRLLFGPRWFRPLLLIGALVLASHLLLDVATSYGTQLLNPFTRTKFSLDLLFVIDPYLTALVLAGAVLLFWPAGWLRTAGGLCLGLAGGYLFLCSIYHHQALGLARLVFQADGAAVTTVAALPQPFSPRRWHLLAVVPGGMKQTFVELPYWPFNLQPGVSAAMPGRQNPHFVPRIPATAYRPPGSLEIHHWAAAPHPDHLPPEGRRLLDVYLECTRFPLLAAAVQKADGLHLTWLDLRFSLPGRVLPLFNLRLDRNGELASWQLTGSGPPLTGQGPIHHPGKKTIPVR